MTGTARGKEEEDIAPWFQVTLFKGAVTSKKRFKKKNQQK